MCCQKLHVRKSKHEGESERHRSMCGDAEVHGTDTVQHECVC